MIDLDDVSMNLTINKANACSLVIEFEGEDAPEDGVQVLFAVKRMPGFEYDSLIEKTVTVESSSITIDLGKDDTDISTGLYFWNAMILFNDGNDPWTLIKDWPMFRIVP